MDKVKQFAACHEAGVFVMSLVQVGQEPQYDSGHVCVKKTYDFLTTHDVGKIKNTNIRVKKFSLNPSFYDIKKIKGFKEQYTINYPSQETVIENSFEFNKIKKEAFKTIAGLAAKHVYCNSPEPDFNAFRYSNKSLNQWDELELFQIDEYCKMIQIMHGLDDFNCELIESNANEIWQEVVSIVKTEKFKKAFNFVKDELISEGLIHGDSLDNLIEKSREMLQGEL